MTSLRHSLDVSRKAAQNLTRTAKQGQHHVTLEALLRPLQELAYDDNQ